jgi:hypothetical protein
MHSGSASCDILCRNNHCVLPFIGSTYCMSLDGLTKDEVTRVLAYAGLVLVAFELVKSLIVNPIKVFYRDVTFGAGMPFKSYEHDVMSRHRNEFEACLLYLRDFMEAIDADDMQSIQELRQHRNELAHDFAHRMHKIDVEHYMPLLERANKALFKLSNYRMYIEIGSDPAFKNLGIDWNTAKGPEYALLEEVLSKVMLLRGVLRSD